jgi:hypothetical protein
MTLSKLVVVDGGNVAYAELSQKGEPKVSNLIAVRRALKQKGYEPIFTVDASLRHQMDDPDQLEALIDDQVIRQAPAGTDADYFILEIAEQQDAYVVSNDEFERWRDQYPWIERRRVPLMIVKGQVELYEKLGE